MLKVELPGMDRHEVFGCSILRVENVKALHDRMEVMVSADTRGLWPQTAHPTWAVYAMLRWNGFAPVYSGSNMFGDPCRAPRAPAGEIVWYNRYMYSHQGRVDSE